MKQKETNNELDILLPESDVTINGEKIDIKPFPFAELPKVIKVLSKMGMAIYELITNDDLQFNENNNLIINQAFIESVGTVVENHFPEVMELTAIYTGKTVDFYKDNAINGEDGLLLIIGIIERNYDFFTKRLAPALTKVKAKQK